MSVFKKRSIMQFIILQFSKKYKKTTFNIDYITWSFVILVHYYTLRNPKYWMFRSLLLLDLLTNLKERTRPYYEKSNDRLQLTDIGGFSFSHTLPSSHFLSICFTRNLTFNYSNFKLINFIYFLYALNYFASNMYVTYICV